MHARTRTTATTLLVAAMLATPVAVAPAHAAVPPAPALIYTSDRDGDTELYLRSGDGTVRQLTRNTAADFGAAWSPDGRRIAFVSDRDGDPEVFVMHADGTGVRQLTRNRTAANGAPVVDQSPAWSPKGHQIVFVSNRDGGEPEVYKMQADGRRQVRLTRTPAYVSNHTPSWAPDGKSIVFSSDRVGYDNYEVFRMRTDGSGVTRLTRTAAGIDDNAPEYSPDGRRIAFSSTRSGGQHDLFTMSSGGTDVRRLGGDPALDDVFPRWTADGRRLLFSTFAGPEGRPSEDVWVTGADGTSRSRVVADASADSGPDPRPRS